MTKDVPLAARALGREVKVVVLKGRQNYLCRKAVDGFGLLGGALLAREQDVEAFERLRPWLDETETGDRAELTFEPPESLWSELAVGADRCLGRRCAFVGMCFSEAARRRAREADLVIVNHALYFADLGIREQLDTSILPEHAAVVFDEAHRLEDTASDWLGGGVSRYGLARLERDVERACLEAGVPVPARQLDRVRRAGGALIGAVEPPSGRRRLREVPLTKGRTLVERLARARRKRWPGRTTSSTCSRVALRVRPQTSRRASRGTSSIVSSGRSTALSGGRPSTSRGGSARRCGRAARRRFSSPRR